MHNGRMVRLRHTSILNNWVNKLHLKRQKVPVTKSRIIQTKVAKIKPSSLHSLTSTLRTNHLTGMHSLAKADTTRGME